MSAKRQGQQNHTKTAIRRIRRSHATNMREKPLRQNYVYVCVCAFVKAGDKPWLVINIYKQRL